VRHLPAASRIQVVHAGRALTPAIAARAEKERSRNHRYHWLGERSHRQALALLAGSHLLVLSSQLEGGANVIGEAAVLGVPIVATRIDGTVGLLGRRYPGLFSTGDAAALQRVLLRAEREPAFYDRLRRATKDKAPLFSRTRERRTWRNLLAELWDR
jgi:glycosyltransferase involved in cell wall biosynthesis